MIEYRSLRMDYDHIENDNGSLINGRFRCRSAELHFFTYLHHNNINCKFYFFNKNLNPKEIIKIIKCVQVLSDVQIFFIFAQTVTIMKCDKFIRTSIIIIQSETTSIKRIRILFCSVAYIKAFE